MHSLSVLSMAATAFAFTSPLPGYGSQVSSVPNSPPIMDCFGTNGVIEPCPKTMIDATTIPFTTEPKTMIDATTIPFPTEPQTMIDATTIPFSTEPKSTIDATTKPFTTYPPIMDCFNDKGNIRPCPTTTASPTSTTVTTYPPIKDCFDDQGNFTPCPSETATAAHDAPCCDTPGFCSCPSTPTSTSVITQITTITQQAPTATFCLQDGHSAQCPITTPSATSVPDTTCTEEAHKATPTLIVIDGVTVTAPGPDKPVITTSSKQVTATFCLKDGHSAQCAITTAKPTATATTSVCEGSYFNGACQCPCGAACSCPAGSMTTSVRAITAYA